MTQGPSLAPRSGISIIFLAFLLSLAGCKTPPAPEAGFITARPEAQKPEDVPFHRAWWKPGVELKQYEKIFIAPVNTKYMLPATAYDKLAVGDLEEQANELAKYTENALRQAFSSDPKRRFWVVEKRGPRTLTLEVALVEVIPTKSVANAVTYWFLFVPISKGRVAMESRLRDGVSGKVVATFADRESGKVSPFNVKDLSKDAHARAIIDEWAVQFVQVMNKSQGEIVKDSRPFTLKPW